MITLGRFKVLGSEEVISKFIRFDEDNHIILRCLVPFVGECDVPGHRFSETKYTSLSSLFDNDSECRWFKVLNRSTPSILKPYEIRPKEITISLEDFMTVYLSL